MALDIGGSFTNKSDNYSISYTRSESSSETVKKNNIKLGSGNVNNIYLGTKPVKSIYLGSNLLYGNVTENTSISAKYTLSLDINSSAANQAKYSTYSYFIGKINLGGTEDQPERTVNTYMHSAYSYIKFLVGNLRKATPQDNILATKPTYLITNGFGIKTDNIKYNYGQYDLLIYNSDFTLIEDSNGNPIPFAQFSVYSDYQKLNCNVWRSDWYNDEPEPPTEPENPTATITLSTNIAGNSTSLKCVGVTMLLLPANTSKEINLSFTNGNIAGLSTVIFDNLTDGRSNTIQFSNFKFVNGIFETTPAGYGDLIANVNGADTTIYSGSLSSLSGSLRLNCTSTSIERFIINISIQQTS